MRVFGRLMGWARSSVSSSVEAMMTMMMMMMTVMVRWRC